MKLRNVLIVYKKSSYQVYAKERKDRRFIHLIRKGHYSTSRFLPSHETHEEALEQVQKIFKKRGIRARSVYRAHRFDESRCDLVVTVGGDGTFLEASHQIKTSLILGVNSSPRDSVGMFCSATIKTLPRLLDQIQDDDIDLFELTRLQVQLGKVQLTFPVLNDLLIAHANPAATSRYLLQSKGIREEQKSSGIWIATPAGSTAAIHGAGGKLLPIRSRKFQFVVREPYAAPGKKVEKARGILGPNDELVIDSKMRKGGVYLDGPHKSFPFIVGDRVVITANAPRLRVVAYNQARRDFFS